MQVRRGFVHMQMRGEYPKLWIALPKPGVVFFERSFCLPADLGIRTGIFPVADLDDDLVERLFLFFVDDMLRVVRYDAVAPFLLFVVFYTTKKSPNSCDSTSLQNNGYR